MSQTKFSISQSARIAGVSRKTFYKHIETKPISTEQDNNGRPVIDASELLRVYGDDCKFERAGGDRETVEDKQEVTPSIDMQVGLATELAVLKKENELLRSQNSSQKENYEEQIDYLRLKLDDTLSETKKLTALITDQSQNKSGAGEWEKSIKALEARVANSEKESKDIKEKAIRIVDQNKLLKEALADEKKKTWVQKLFG